MKLLTWARKNIYLRGERFTLANHSYLRDIYTQQHNHEVYRKAAQVGITTYHIIKALWLADKNSIKVIYYFPTDSDVSDFSQDRLQTIIDESPYLKSKSKKVDKVHLKKIGDSTIYLRGLLGRAKTRSVDADYVILDELDVAPADKIEYAKDRILHSRLGLISELSTPSIPGTGIDRSFSASDSRFYIIRCDNCGWSDPLEEAFPDCVLVTNECAQLCCPRCKSPLNLSSGEWLPTRSSKTAGWHISHLITGIKTLDEIYDLFKKSRTDTEKMRFYNSILGLPYSGELRPLSQENIESCISGEEMWEGGEGLYMGVDVGEILHIAVGTRENGIVKVVRLIEAIDWETLNETIDAFGIVNCVIDALPYKYFAKRFAQAFPGRVKLAYFREGAFERGYEGKTGESVEVVKIDRTESLDELVWMIKEKKIVLPARCREVELAIKHLLNLVKEKVVSTRGDERLVYRRGVENHFAMAFNYLITAIKTSPISSRARKTAIIKRKFIR